MTNESYLWNKRYQLKVRVLANRIYQLERKRRFEFFESAVKAFTIIAGSYAFINVANPEVVKWYVSIITILNALALVFGFGSKARDSNKRAAEWVLLERDIDLVGERDFKEKQINSWLARCNEIEIDEPAPHKVLMELSTKRANDALGGEYELMLNWFQKNLPIIFIP